MPFRETSAQFAANEPALSNLHSLATGDTEVMPMNDEALAFLASLPVTPEPWECDLSELRRLGREIPLSAAGELEPVASVEDVDAEGVPARLYRPTGNERNVLVWFHGGGWLSGSVESYDPLARSLARDAGCAVLSVEYHLAPEHPYPVGLEDCWAATRWATKYFDKIAVGGDSSGGNLAAAIALRARDRALPVALQLLVYPVLDYSAIDGPFYRDFGAHFDRALGRTGEGARHQARIRWIWEQYIPYADKRLEAEASPMNAPSVRGVAPALMITAEYDILRDEDETYARRLEAEGVPVRLINYRGQIHGFFHLFGAMTDGRAAIAEAADALRLAF